MMLPTRNGLGVIVTGFIGVLAAAAPAQPSEGNLIIGVSSSSAGIYYRTGPGPAPLQPISTIATSALLMEPGNNDLIVGTATTPSHILRVTRNGNATTLVTLPSVDGAHGIALDQDGSLRVVSINRVYRLQPSGTGYSVAWTTITGVWNAIARDPSSGDFIIGDFNSGRLMRMDRETDQLTTLSLTQGALIAGIAYNPLTGLFAIARLTTPNGLVFVTPNGVLVRSVALRFGNSVAVNEETGDVFAGSNNGVITHTDKDGTILGTHDYGTHTIAAFDVWADRNVALSGSGVAGTQQTVTLRFANSPQRSYCAALALNDHPGLPAGSGTLNLTPDPVFFLTVCNNIPGLTTAFSGVTDSTGGATAKFTIPANLPVGIRLFVGAAALNPAVPGGLDISNTECVKVR